MFLLSALTFFFLDEIEMLTEDLMLNVFFALIP